MSAIQSITRTSSSVQDGDEFHFTKTGVTSVLYVVCVGEWTGIVGCGKEEGAVSLDCERFFSKMEGETEGPQ